MRSLFERKLWIILVSILALAALTTLAIGLREEMPFREAQHFSRGEAGAARVNGQNVVNAFTSVPLWKQLSAWALFLLMVVLIGALLSPELRKRLIRIVIRVALTYWLLYILFTRYPQVLAPILDLNVAMQGNAPAASQSSSPMPEFMPPQTTSLIAYLVSFGIALCAALVLWKAFSLWREYNASRVGEESLQKIARLARVARSSLLALSSGRDSTDVIMNCYFRMSDVVADRRRLQRDAGMTPGEFAIRLEHAGLPADAVQRLTRLFEHVRYGSHRAARAEVNEAVACLTSILQYCGEAV